ncbi:hypothetical protein AGMMS4957_16070 [Bacteroidia bacterium]|nr:hypothetical protein AGMMS4957_16070 [Bacteroidia bacterium]
MNTQCQHICFSDKAYNAIINETFRKDPLETGGILLGHILDNGIWIVMEVLPPGWRSTFQYAYFEYDEQFVNYIVQSVASQYEQELSLLGLWHRHPGSMDTFSGTDDGTNRTFASLNPKGAISGLVNVDPKFRLTMRHVSNPLRYKIVEFEVGDDLIPSKYFKLKYEPSQGLYPQNASRSPNKRYEIGSSGNMLLKFLNTKFLLIFIIGIVLSSFCTVLITEHCHPKEADTVTQFVDSTKNFDAQKSDTMPQERVKNDTLIKQKSSNGVITPSGEESNITKKKVSGIEMIQKLFAWVESISV